MTSPTDNNTSQTSIQYPLHTSVRLRERTLQRIKRRSSKYHETIDSIVTRILDSLEEYEKAEAYGCNKDKQGVSEQQ